MLQSAHPAALSLNFVHTSFCTLQFHSALGQRLLNTNKPDFYCGQSSIRREYISVITQHRVRH